MNKYTEIKGVAHVEKNGSLHVCMAKPARRGKMAIIVDIPANVAGEYEAKGFKPATMKDVKAAFVSGQPKDERGLPENEAASLFEKHATYEPRAHAAPAAKTKPQE